MLEQKPIHTKLEIVEKTPINHDCYIYKLKFAGEPFELKIGQHFRIHETIKTAECPEGEAVMRKYTPISECSQKETLDLLIKIYRPNVNPNFPNGGKLTPYLESLKVGDTINVEGPFGRFGYAENGTVIIDGEPIPRKKIFFIAGGSGITPIYQTIMEIVKMKDEKIEMILLFANKSEKDIVLRKELDSLKDRIKVHYIIDKPDEEGKWEGLTGYVTKELLNQICALDEKDTMYIHCGPGPMNQVIRNIFSENYPESRLFKY